MPAATIHPSATVQLQQLLDRIAMAVGDALAAMVARNIVVEAEGLALIDHSSLLSILPRAHVLVCASFASEPPGRMLAISFETRDACTLVGLQLLGDTVNAERRRAEEKLTEDGAQSFAELGSALCTALRAPLRAAGHDDELVFHGLGTASDAASLPPAWLPPTALLVCKLSCRIGDYPESVGYLLVDRETAASWNRGPLASTDGNEAANEDAHDFIDLPASQVHVVLNAYLTNEMLLPVLRRCCRRLGCELRRHPRAETPEPTSHRGEIVLMDVPAGVHRQLDSCRRIKHADAGTRVGLLLHQPSRSMVTQAFDAGADVILGLPMDDATLSARLRALFA